MSLSLEGLVEKVYRAFIVSVGKIQGFSSVARSTYCATKLKPSTKKVDFLTKAIDTEASLPFDQAWSRASKKVGPLQSIDQGAQEM